MFGYINDSTTPIGFKKVYRDSSKWVVYNGITTDKVNHYIQAFINGDIKIIVKDSTKHERIMMRMFILSAFGKK